MKSDFDRYKETIDLAAFAEQVYGYRINQKKSSRREVVMQNPEQTETLIIARNAKSGHFTYFNPHQEKDRGTVIDFCLYRNGGDWKKVRTELGRYVEGAIQGATVANIPAGKGANKIDYKLLPLKDRKFLYSRGISDKTLDAPEFVGRIFNQQYKSPEGDVFLNTVFPLYKHEKIVGLEVKNFGYHGNAAGSQRSDSFWLSSPEGLRGQTIVIVVCESAIDALSFHQLCPPQPDIKRLYVSMSGYIADGQKTLFHQLVQQYKPARIILANDNDHAGIRHNINLIGWLETEVERSRKLKAKISTPAADTVQLRIELNLGPGDEILLPAVGQLFAARNEELKQWAVPLFEIQAETTASGEAHIDVKSPQKRFYLEKMEESLILLKGLKGKLEVRRAEGKDVNEDLMNRTSGTINE